MFFDLAGSLDASPLMLSPRGLVLPTQTFDLLGLNARGAGIEIDLENRVLPYLLGQAVEPVPDGATTDFQA